MEGGGAPSAGASFNGTNNNGFHLGPYGEGVGGGGQFFGGFYGGSVHFQGGGQFQGGGLFRGGGQFHRGAQYHGGRASVMEMAVVSHMEGVNNVAIRRQDVATTTCSWRTVVEFRQAATR